MRTSRGLMMAGAIVISAALAMSGCTSNTEGSGPSGSTTAVKPTKVGQIANLLTDKIKQSGKLIVGTDPTYKPNEDKDPNGTSIRFDAGLLTAVARVLGVTSEYLQ